jgi:hypothetical protein
MKHFFIVCSLFINFFVSQVVAQDAPDCIPNSLFDPFVEGRALEAWRTCDMRCSTQPGPHHILLVGDSVGALMQASPPPLATIVNGVKSKSWDYFLTNPAPQGMTNWRVLNTAVSGNAAIVMRQRVEHCLGDPTSDTAKLFRDTAPGRVWMEIGGNDIY